MKPVKSLQPQSHWTVQSVSDGTGRRVLTLSNNSARHPLRRRSAGQHNGVVRLAVKSEPEELSGFEPAIRLRS